MIIDSQIEIEKVMREELALCMQMEERTVLLGETAILEMNKKQLLCDQTVLEGLQFQILDSERTNKRSGEVVSECNSRIAILESELEIRYAKEKELAHRIMSLKGLLDSMVQQLRLMNEGSGNFFFPRPICSSPTEPITMIHTLNACPLCSLWYRSFDYVPASCGHCYHPWCLAEHAKTSDKCLLRSCEKPFLINHKIALGIRPPYIASSLMIPKNVDAHPAKDIVVAKDLCVPGEFCTLTLTFYLICFFSYFSPFLKILTL